MTSQDTSSSEDVMMARSEVVGDAEWIDARQAAYYTSSSVWTIRNACSLRELRHIRIGRINGPIRTRIEWVDAWMMRGVQGPVVG